MNQENFYNPCMNIGMIPQYMIEYTKNETITMQDAILFTP